MVGAYIYISFFYRKKRKFYIYLLKMKIKWNSHGHKNLESGQCLVSIPHWNRYLLS